MEIREKITLNDVLNEFVAGNDQPTAENIEKLVKRFPQFRSDLIDFAAAWAEQLVLPAAPELSTEESKALVDQAMSHVLNMSYSRDEQAQENVESDDAIDSLTGEAQRAGLNASDFAKACGLDLVLISKLNNRQIQWRTIPAGLFGNIGRRLLRSAAMVSAYLALPPRTMPGKAFLAREKPEHTGQQSFADAVEASALSPAEKARWLDEVAGMEES